jgi:CheY-like chemotaxis protein
VAADAGRECDIELLQPPAQAPKIGPPRGALFVSGRTADTSSDTGIGAIPMNPAPAAAADDLATPIRVLYAASSPADGEFVRAETTASSPLISVTCATGASEALTCLDAIGPFDAVLVDPDLPDGTMPALIARIRHRNPGVGIVACLKGDDAAAAAPAMEAGAHEWIPKRRDTIAQLYPVFRRAIDSSRQSAAGTAAREPHAESAEAPARTPISEGLDAALAMREAALAHEAERARLEQALADQQTEAARLAVELAALRGAHDVTRQEHETKLRATQEAARAERETMRAVLAEREEARTRLARDLEAREREDAAARHQLEADLATRDQEIARLSGELDAARHAAPVVPADAPPDRERLSARAEAGRLIAAVSDDFEAVIAVLDRECQRLNGAGGDGHAPLDPGGLGHALREAHALTRMLKAFSRREIERARVDVHALMTRLQPVIARAFAEDVQLELDVPVDAGSVSADPVALELVLMSVIVAVREQMPTGGRVSIAARPAAAGPDATDADRSVRLVVTARRWRREIAIPELASDRWLAPVSPAVSLGHLDHVLKASDGWIDTSGSTADQLAITIGLASA